MYVFCNLHDNNSRTILLHLVSERAHLIQGTLQCKGSHRQLVGGVTDFLFVSSELQKPFQAPQLLPDLHCNTP